MLGLIKKDLFLIKNNFKFLAIILVFYVLLAFVCDIDIAFLPPFLSVMIMISSFSYDNYNKWDIYAITLPNGKKNVVKAKYLATLFLIAVTSLAVIILSLLISYANTKSINVKETFEVITLTICATLLIQAIMFPAIFKFGAEKARIGVFIIVFGVAILGGVLTNVIDFDSLIGKLSFLNDYLIIILPIIAIVILFASYLISEKIYSKKEF